jgi:DNA-binding transcriptional LysR family regulator
MPAVSFLTVSFSLAHPAAAVEIRSMTSRAIQQALDSFEIDAGLTCLDNEPLENVRRVPLYRETYVFAARRGHPMANRARTTWKETVAQRLCLLSEDMQNRRIIDQLAAAIGVTIRPEVVSSSFLAICSHLRHGEWASIVPHSFSYVFGSASDLVAIELIEATHSQSIGLALSDRNPPSPMASALLASTLETDAEAGLAMGCPPA